jgi:hypothetical protein
MATLRELSPDTVLGAVREISANTSQNKELVLDWLGWGTGFIKTMSSAISTVAFFALDKLLVLFVAIITSVVMEYIVFILFLIFLYCLLTGTPFFLFGMFERNRNSQNGGGMVNRFLQSLPIPRFIKNIIAPQHKGPPGTGRNFLNILFPWMTFSVGDQMKRMSGSFSQSIDSVRKRVGGYDNRKSTEAIDRPTANGRCNDREWFNVGKQCLNTEIPKDIVWNIPQHKSTEWKWLPSKLQEHISKNGKRKQVIIPWDIQGSFYVPDCQNAKFNDGTSASYLFRDNGLTCDSVVRLSTKHTPMMRKRKDPKDNLIPIREEECEKEDPDEE